MKLKTSLFKKILADSGLITKKEFDSLKREAQHKKISLEKLIVERGIFSDEELGQLLADGLSVPYVNLRKVSPKKEILTIIPQIVAKKQEVIVFDRIPQGLKLAMHHPHNLEIKEFIERKTGEKTIVYFATASAIRDALKFYKKDLKEEFESVLGRKLEELKLKGGAGPLPVIKLINIILEYGYENRASDIHLEPYHKKTILRYRIDGVLHDLLVLPKSMHDLLISRIKIMASLRTDIHDIPQDGHFSFSVPEEKVDVRVSVAPIEEGEKVVLRILAERVKRFNLEELGLSPNDLETIKKNLQKSWGMILSSGPTGCGKTTTLYTILKILNTREVNIMTIEDPIEYDIEGVNQIQVNPKVNLTFSEGLRAIMRQDPNIIMVGEIRDKETAKLATNAAMTGHLVLSTFHAIDAPTVLTRLQEMEVESFVIASTVNLVIAQRLVRRICLKCIESYEVSVQRLSSFLPQQLLSKLPITSKNTIRLFRGRGCPVCQNTGYSGRVGIFELLEVSDPIKKLIMEKANASQIEETARKLGMRTMLEDGLTKVESGITTIEEILKAGK